MFNSVMFLLSYYNTQGRRLRALPANKDFHAEILLTEATINNELSCYKRVAVAFEDTREVHFAHPLKKYCEYDQVTKNIIELVQLFFRHGVCSSP